MPAAPPALLWFTLVQKIYAGPVYVSMQMSSNQVSPLRKKHPDDMVAFLAGLRLQQHSFNASGMAVQRRRQMHALPMLDT